MPHILRVASALFAATFGLALLNALVWFLGMSGQRASSPGWGVLFTVLAGLQLLVGLVATVVFIIGWVRRPVGTSPMAYIVGTCFSVVAAAGAPVRWSDLVLGTAVSGISAYLCIHFFLKLLERIGMLPFVVYRLLLGGVLIWYLTRLLAE